MRNFILYPDVHHKALVESVCLSHCGDGDNLDRWRSGGRGGNTFFSCFHLHHHGGLPRCLHLCHLHYFLKAGERELYEMVESKSC